MMFLRLIFCTCLWLQVTAQAAQPLQPWLDTALPGAIIRLPPGTYQGPAVISKPLTLEGEGKVIIDAGKQGTVLTVKADHVTLRGLTLRGSGDSHDKIDGGIMAEGNHLLIEHNVIEDVLFGISLHKTNDSMIRHNRIRSRPGDSADRGDGLRLWYSMFNRIEDNDISQMRDITVSNSPRNRFSRNSVTHSRRGLNFLFSHRTLIEHNRFENNSTGIVALNSEGLIIRRNRITHAMDASGAGIALKEISAAAIIGWGLKISAEQGLARITHVIDDSPAQQAGLAPGDLWVALNGQRITHANLEEKLGRLNRQAHPQPKQCDAEILVFREEILLNLSLSANLFVLNAYSLNTEKASALAEERRMKWLSGSS